MSNNDTTTIQYDIVSNGIKTIDDIANKMDSIFNDMNLSMNRALSPDVFAGIAAESTGADYNTFKSQYVEFISLVKQFADEYRTASGTMETHEGNLEKRTQTLNEDLTPM